MAIVEVSITPLGTAKTSISDYVAECVKIARESGLPCQLTGMGTILEGDLDQIMTVIRQMQESVFASGATRVISSIKIDDRRDKPGHDSSSKVASVEIKL
ncbi:MAG: MTH1187 family thiamine-binding protein [Proteobacteria bacterium]|nr:MTH1187 family thiamine-binding protein [Desulfobulbaceae bacterium]MBU4152148.1 MTH1187 family thiamine-binding protein [Pseudomonadota bacterium]